MKNILRKLICALAGMAIILVSSVLSMVKGWGLQPKSWIWIIGVNVLVMMIGRSIMELGGEDK